MAAVVRADPEIDQDLNDWLPITKSRKANWFYSAFHNVTATVGAGVLSFPIAMKHLGWGGGVSAIVLSWVITLFTMWQLTELHESTEEEVVVDGRGEMVKKRRRFDRYHELGQRAFGKRLGLWIIVPQQLVIEVGVDIVYMVTGGQCLMNFACLVTDKGSHCIPHGGGLQNWILIFASIHFFLAQLPSFNSLALVSFVAAAMSLSYSSIAWISLLVVDTDDDTLSHPAPSPSPSPPHSIPEYVGVLTSLGQIAFAYASHNVALEIQATLPSTPDRPSKKPMMQGAIIAYVVIAICYFPVAFVGHAKLGHRVSENVLFSRDTPRGLIAVANLMVVIHMIGSYQLYAMPVFDIMEAFLVIRCKFKPTYKLRLIFRTIYVAFTCFIAICIPFFGGLLGFLGGFAFAPLTYFMPCIIWLIIRKPTLFSFSWLINWICIIIGVALMISSSIGGLINIIKNIQQCKVFSHTLPDINGHGCTL